MRPEIQIIVSLGILLNKDGKVLLTLRNDPEQPWAHHKWELPGGGIEFGEKPEEAVKREMLEETGYKVAIEQFIPFLYTKVWNNPDEDVHVILLSFLCKPIEKIDGPQSPEIADMRWFTKSEIKGLDLLPGVMEILNATS